MRGVAWKALSLSQLLHVVDGPGVDFAVHTSFGSDLTCNTGAPALSASVLFLWVSALRWGLAGLRSACCFPCFGVRCICLFVLYILHLNPFKLRVQRSSACPQNIVESYIGHSSSRFPPHRSACALAPHACGALTDGVKPCVRAVIKKPPISICCALWALCFSGLNNTQMRVYSQSQKTLAQGRLHFRRCYSTVVCWCHLQCFGPTAVTCHCLVDMAYLCLRQFNYWRCNRPTCSSFIYMLFLPVPLLPHQLRKPWKMIVFAVLGIIGTVCAS